jgi:hypothetical protein
MNLHCRLITYPIRCDVIKRGSASDVLARDLERASFRTQTIVLNVFVFNLNYFRPMTGRYWSTIISCQILTSSMITFYPNIQCYVIRDNKSVVTTNKTSRYIYIYITTDVQKHSLISLSKPHSSKTSKPLVIIWDNKITSLYLNNLYRRCVFCVQTNRSKREVNVSIKFICVNGKV